jgi:hypothetical protein
MDSYYLTFAGAGVVTFIYIITYDLRKDAVGKYLIVVIWHRMERVGWILNNELEDRGRKRW